MFTGIVSSEIVMQDIQEEFVLTCESFVLNFEAVLPGEVDDGRLYELKFAFDSIESLSHVESKQFGGRYPVLVSHQNEMGLFKRIVRQKSKCIKMIEFDFI